MYNTHKQNLKLCGKKTNALFIKGPDQTNMKELASKSFRELVRERAGQTHVHFHYRLSHLKVGVTTLKVLFHSSQKPTRKVAARTFI